MKILYIEDFEKLARFVCILLEKHGYEVEHHALGKPGLERFRQEPESWDAVIIDLELPDVSGQKLIPEIAVLRPALPIVVYSGMKGLEDRFELYSSGASALLTKPCGAKDLLDVLKGLIEIPPEPVK